MRKYLAICLVMIAGLSLFVWKNTDTHATEMQRTVPKEYGEMLAAANTNESKLGYDELYVEKGNAADALERIGKEKLCEVGENIAISSDEVKQYTEFFKLSGSADPKKEAVAYAEERNALYVAAMENGYAVTDEEIYAYLDELKEILQEEDNREQYKNAMEGFASEEEYWAFQFEVYKVNLPIQNYVSSLEDVYRDEHVEENLEEFDKLWSEEFEKVKKKLVAEQNFVAVK